MILSNGQIEGAGLNNFGQVGFPTSPGIGIFVPPGGGPILASFTRIATGSYHTLAVDNEGGLWAWGCNISGEIAAGNLTFRSVPERVTF